VEKNFISERYLGVYQRNRLETALIALTVRGFGDYKVDLGPSPTIIDTGAHIGIAALDFLSRHPGVKLTCVEPDPDNVVLLKKNLELFPGVKIIEAAVSSETGESLLSVSPNGWSWGNSLHHQYSGTESIMVSTTTLSSLVEGRVDLLKIDIEGSEVEAIEELSDHPDEASRVNQMVIEFHPREVSCSLEDFLDTLETLGFKNKIGAGIRVARIPSFLASVCDSIKMPVVIHSKRRPPQKIISIPLTR
jgi:FkbM family methyltransferase